MVELPEDVRALFEGANFAHVATLLPDGSPHSVPVWVCLENGCIGFFTQEGSRKARNLAHDNRVALSIADHDHPYRMAQIRGRVVGPAAPLASVDGQCPTPPTGAARPPRTRRSPSCSRG
jgi:PPOX class probable F420-dependent enzyme